MAGKQYIYERLVFNKATNFLVDFKDLKNKRFLTRSKCEEDLEHNQSKDFFKNEEALLLTNSYIKYNCVDMCFCSIYRKRILKKILILDLKTAYKYTVAGIKRMRIDIDEIGFKQWCLGLFGSY